MKQILQILLNIIGCYVFGITYLGIFDFIISPTVMFKWIIFYFIIAHCVLIFLYKYTNKAGWYTILIVFAISNYVILFFYNPDALISAGLL